MPSRKPPYFPFYVMDFLGSTAAATLSLRQIGAYLFLLCRQWDSPDGYLPLDDAVLGMFSRLGDTFPTEGRAIIEQCFEVRGNKTWNARLRTAWVKYRNHVAASRRGGVKSGQSRRKHIEGPLPFTSKSKASNQNQNQNHKRKRTTEKAPVPGAAPADSSGSAIVVPAKRTWLTPYGEAWQERFGPDSLPPWGELASELARPHVRALGAAETLKRWQRFLATRESTDFARPARFIQGLGQWAEDFALATTKRPANTAAQVRKDSYNALIEGGLLNDGRSVDQGDGGIVGRLPRQGSGPGGDGDSGTSLPEGVGPVDGSDLALRGKRSGAA